MNAGLQDAFSDYAFQFRESLDYTELQVRSRPTKRDNLATCRARRAPTRPLQAQDAHFRFCRPQITGLGTAKDAGIAIFGFLFGLSYDLFPAWCELPPGLGRFTGSSSACNVLPPHASYSSAVHLLERTAACTGGSRTHRPLPRRSAFVSFPHRWAILASVAVDVVGFLLIWALYTHQLSAPYPIVWCIFVLAYGCNAGCAPGSHRRLPRPIHLVPQPSPRRAEA